VRAAHLSIATHRTQLNSGGDRSGIRKTQLQAEHFEHADEFQPESRVAARPRPVASVPRGQS
jgi:hypothetical protein